MKSMSLTYDDLVLVKWKIITSIAMPLLLKIISVHIKNCIYFLKERKLECLYFSKITLKI